MDKVPTTITEALSQHGFLSEASFEFILDKFHHETQNNSSDRRVTVVVETDWSRVEAYLKLLKDLVTLTPILKRDEQLRVDCVVRFNVPDGDVDLKSRKVPGPISLRVILNFLGPARLLQELPLLCGRCTLINAQVDFPTINRQLKKLQVNYLESDGTISKRLLVVEELLWLLNDDFYTIRHLNPKGREFGYLTEIIDRDIIEQQILQNRLAYKYIDSFGYCRFLRRLANKKATDRRRAVRLIKNNP